MKNLLFFLFLSAFLVRTTFTTYAQTAAPPEKQGQMWNVSNKYFGTINSNTIDAGTALDSVKGTTAYFSQSEWIRVGKNSFDSARVLMKNISGTGGYYVPYSQGLQGRGTISVTGIVLKASTTSTVTPTVLVDLQQSPNGLTGWTNIPGVTQATVAPTSRTVALTTTFNNADTYQRYLRAKVASTDTCSVQFFFDFKPKNY